MEAGSVGNAPRTPLAPGDSLGVLVGWFTAVFSFLTALFLAASWVEMARWLSRTESSGVSPWTLSLYLIPGVAVLTIPLALALTLAAGRGSGRRLRVVAAFVLPVCLLEAGFLFAVVPEANQRARATLFAAMVDDASALGDLPRGVREMSVAELKRASSESLGGADFELHKRASMPVAALFLAILGLAIAGRLRGRVAKLALVALAGAGWLALLQLGASLDSGAAVPAWIGAWIPAIAVCLLAMLAWRWSGAQPVEL